MLRDELVPAAQHSTRGRYSLSLFQRVTVLQLPLVDLRCAGVPSFAKQSQM
jgi:hypothetical protein